MTDGSPHAEETGLTPAEEAFLAAYGGAVPDSSSAAEAAGQVRQSPWATGLEGALAAADVAELLHVPSNEVERLAAGGTLYSIVVDGVRHFPGWQFSGDRPLPHLAEVLASLQDAHPATVAGFMTLPNDELEGLSPARWLAQNRPVRAVSWLAETLLT